MANSKKHTNHHELDALNIENLFTPADGTKPHTNGKLDINTLFGKKHNDNENFEFDSEILLESIKKKKQKLNECHYSMYKSCCDAIMMANKSGITDIVHNIPENVPDVMIFKPLECLRFMKDKLEEQNISCRILSKTSIFITWHNIEEKIKAKKKELDRHSTSSSYENVSKYDDKNSYQD